MFKKGDRVRLKYAPEHTATVVKDEKRYQKVFLKFDSDRTVHVWRTESITLINPPMNSFLEIRD